MTDDERRVHLKPGEKWLNSKPCYFQLADGSRIINPVNYPCDRCMNRYHNANMFSADDEFNSRICPNYKEETNG